jgi:hypothetical protein
VRDADPGQAMPVQQPRQSVQPTVVHQQAAPAPAPAPVMRQAPQPQPQPAPQQAAPAAAAASAAVPGNRARHGLDRKQGVEGERER